MIFYAGSQYAIKKNTNYIRVGIRRLGVLDQDIKIKFRLSLTHFYKHTKILKHFFFFS